jgi:hypothetical protein
MTTPSRVEFIDPTTYAFRHHIEANKHLNNENDYHQIKPIIEYIDRDYKGQEHRFCDKEQLDAQGSFRIPKALKAAREAGHENVMEHYEAIQRKKKDDDNKASDDFKNQIDKMNQTLIDTIATIKTQQDKNDVRFDKLLNLILSKK